MSYDGRWDPWYETISDQQPYGASLTYATAAEFLSDCEIVEDWGCGLGWFRKLRPEGYVGVDGSCTPHADIVADLRQYRSDVDGIFMRHVLEHNHEWRVVLDNAVASFTHKMALVLFTPLLDTTRVISTTVIGGVEIPDYAFALGDITERFGDADITYALFQSSPDTQYGVEHVLLVEKRAA